jgi:exonuclease SbcD
MRILHTADCHLGQLFYEYDRTYEHQQFLNWLINIINEQKIEILLISGDVFDISNTSAATVKMFYSFLNQAVKVNPNLQVIITAGNHDSASRLESPTPLLESTNIHIVGLIQKDKNGMIDYEKLTIPLKNKEDNVKALCLAVPFLRMGDYPIVVESENPYAEGVAVLYKEAYDYALTKKQAGQVVLAMGHLHTQQAVLSDMDKQERQIMGGVECISAAAFHADIGYVALGHIHKAQRIGGKEHIRYCGSPLPMSFSERNYKHQVVVFEVENDGVKGIRSVEIPVIVPVQCVPEKHSPIEQVLSELGKLPGAEGNRDLAPYLEVRVLEDKPDPSRRHKIEQAIEGKNVRLATITVKSAAIEVGNQTQPPAQQKLDELKPADIFSKVYESTYGNPAPEEMFQLFNQVTQEVAQTEIA